MTHYDNAAGLLSRSAFYKTIIARVCRLMRYLLFPAAIIFFIVAQTSVLQYTPVFFQLYDLLVPFVVYLSLYHSFGACIPVIIAGGMAMDMLSGAPMGIYMASYFLIYLLFRLVPRWVTISDHSLFFLLSVAGVAIENIVFVSAVWMISNISFMTVHALKIILLQLFWVIITAPFLWMLFRFLFAESKVVADGKGKNGS
jgi:cell shape-determining protein MreD